MPRAGLYEIDSWEDLRLNISYHPNEQMTGTVEVPIPQYKQYSKNPAEETVIPLGNYFRATFNCMRGITLMAGSHFDECIFQVAGPIHVSAPEDYSMAADITLKQCIIKAQEYVDPTSEEEEPKKEATPAELESLFILDNLIQGKVHALLDQCTIDIKETTRLVNLQDTLAPTQAKDGKGFELAALSFSKCKIPTLKVNLVKVDGPAIINFSDMELDAKNWQYPEKPTQPETTWTPMIQIDHDVANGSIGRGAQIWFANITWAKSQDGEDEEGKMPNFWVKAATPNVNSDVLNSAKTSALTVRYNGLYIARSYIRFVFDVDDSMNPTNLAEMIKAVGCVCEVNLKKSEDSPKGTGDAYKDYAILSHLVLTDSKVTINGNIGIDTMLDLHNSWLTINGKLEVSGHILLDDWSSLEVKEEVKANGEEVKNGDGKEAAKSEAPDGEAYKIWIVGPYDSRIPPMTDLEDAQESSDQQAGAGEPFNNKILGKMFDAFGDRIAALVFDNGSSVLIGYPNHTSGVSHVKDIKLLTIEGVDYVVTPGHNPQPKDIRMGIGWKCFHPTMCLQQVYVMNEGISERFRPDPFVFG